MTTLESLKQQLEVEEQRLNAEAKANCPKARYTFKVVPCSDKWDALHHALGGVQVIAMLDNEHEFDEYRAKYSVAAVVDRIKHSVTYTWYQGKLYATGSGWCLLNMGERFSHVRDMDEATWLEIKSGVLRPEVLSQYV